MDAGQSSVSEPSKVAVHAVRHSTPSGTTQQSLSVMRRSLQCSLQIVRNLGVLMNASLSFLQYVNHVVSSGLAEINQELNKSLQFKTAKTLVNCFVISRMTILAGVPRYALDWLQRVMNARMLCGAGKYSHVSGFIRKHLHWLPVPQRVRFKL